MASIADLPILSAADFYARDGAGPEAGSRCVIGVLALQGAFLEHLTYLRACGAQAREVRTAKDFDGIDGLVIPGGESTAMALVAARTGMVSHKLQLRPRTRRMLTPATSQWAHIQKFVDSDKPVWGTCAGMILLATEAEGAKAGGQSLLKGLDICVHRNYFGSQVHSFEAAVKVRPEFQERLGGAAELPGVFIRAPALLSVGDGVDVVATVVAERRDVIVAAARGATRLVTAFHPELAASKVWHELFVTMVEASMAGAAAPGAVTTA
ncbi:PDX2 [Symbiodinium sp. KB8]|nr:PDX2 [Symbiodinium sp. KB8]